MESNYDIDVLNERVERESRFLREIGDELGKVIVGQRYLVERLLIGLLCNGHVLLEGLPGLAKTLAVSSLAGAIRAQPARCRGGHCGGGRLVRGPRSRLDWYDHADRYRRRRAYSAWLFAYKQMH